jgi:putative hydrolase of the HAD superfamily
MKGQQTAPDDAQTYDAVVLDLGGVIIPLHRERSESAFRALKAEGFDAAYAGLQAEGFLDAFEIGAVDEVAFFQRLRDWFGVSDERLLEAWHSILEPIPAANLQTLEALANRVPLYLLSNTNGLHMGWIDAHLEREHALPVFGGLFQQRFLSYEMGCRKPDPNIYRQVESEAGLQGKRILFIDDDANNTASASGEGWSTRLHPHNAPLRESVADLL